MLDPWAPLGKARPTVPTQPDMLKTSAFPRSWHVGHNLGCSSPQGLKLLRRLRTAKFAPPVGLRWAKQARVLTPHPQPPYSLTWKSPLDGKFPFLLPASSLSYNQGVVVLVAKRLKYDGKSYYFQTNGFNNSPMEKGNSS